MSRRQRQRKGKGPTAEQLAAYLTRSEGPDYSDEKQFTGEPDSDPTLAMRGWKSAPGPRLQPLSSQQARDLLLERKTKHGNKKWELDYDKASHLPISLKNNVLKNALKKYAHITQGPYKPPFEKGEDIPHAEKMQLAAALANIRHGKAIKYVADQAEAAKQHLASFSKKRKLAKRDLYDGNIKQMPHGARLIPTDAQRKQILNHQVGAHIYSDALKKYTGEGINSLAGCIGGIKMSDLARQQLSAIKADAEERQPTVKEALARLAWVRHLDIKGQFLNNNHPEKVEKRGEEYKIDALEKFVQKNRFEEFYNNNADVIEEKAQALFDNWRLTDGEKERVRQSKKAASIRSRQRSDTRPFQVTPRYDDWTENPYGRYEIFKSAPLRERSQSLRALSK